MKKYKRAYIWGNAVLIVLLVIAAFTMYVLRDFGYIDAPVNWFLLVCLGAILIIALMTYLGCKTLDKSEKGEKK